jgi:hypothetical protein
VGKWGRGECVEGPTRNSKTNHGNKQSRRPCRCVALTASVITHEEEEQRGEEAHVAALAISCMCEMQRNKRDERDIP